LNQLGWSNTAKADVISKLFKKLGTASVVLLFAIPLVLSILFSISNVFDGSAWHMLFAHPQLWPALGLSLFTGMLGLILSFIISVLIIQGFYGGRFWPKLAPASAFMLALPHVGFAIGFAFLIMPSGIVARIIAASLTGWKAPPEWITVHDPFGFFLIAVLVLKEAPFLLWVLINILNRDDIAHSFASQKAAALSLGHGESSIWLRIFLPQILPKIMWPLLVVFVYGSSVVDLGLVIGPTQPPTLADLVWVDLNSSLVANNQRGQVGAIFLTAWVLGSAFALWGATKIFARQRGWLACGPSRLLNLKIIGHTKFVALLACYIAVLCILWVLSFSPLWPFPDLGPTGLSEYAWLRVLQEPLPFLLSVALGFATATTALILIVLWLELQPTNRDIFFIVLAALAVGVPNLLLGLGQYKLALATGLSGTVFGLFWVHLLPVTAYMFIVLNGPYRNFDGRWQSSAAGLMVSRSRFLWCIKWPLLKAPLLSCFAVGFAVSFGQFIPAQLVAAGRFSTLPMEAVTLTSGTNRTLTAAFAILLMLPPLAVFVVTSYFGKPRWLKS
jgi:putative thiamine transport system permease protein